MKESKKEGTKERKKIPFGKTNVDIEMLTLTLSSGAWQCHWDGEDDWEVRITGLRPAGVDRADHHHPQQSQVRQLTSGSPATAAGFQHLPHRGETPKVTSLPVFLLCVSTVWVYVFVDG